MTELSTLTKFSLIFETENLSSGELENIDRRLSSLNKRHPQAITFHESPTFGFTFFGVTLSWDERASS